MERKTGSRGKLCSTEAECPHVVVEVGADINQFAHENF